MIHIQNPPSTKTGLSYQVSAIFGEADRRDGLLGRVDDVALTVLPGVVEDDGAAETKQVRY